MRKALRFGDVPLRKLRDLTLAKPAGTRRRPHLSAASGLVRVAKLLYVIADDELHLAVFPAQGDEAGELIRLFPGELPKNKARRKAAKPDFEVLTFLHPFARYTCGALLALGSGSRPNRRSGALVALDRFGMVAGSPRLIDLTGLYDTFSRALSTLNIEGAAITGDSVRFLQRGNKNNTPSASVELRLSSFLHSLEEPSEELPQSAVKVTPYNLGKIDGIPLGFTDAAALPDGGLVFTAVAENSGDSYRDGRCAGAAIGIIGGDGELKRIDRFEGPYKIEGIDATVDGDVLNFLAVTDADDARVPASLLAGQIVLRR